MELYRWFWGLLTIAALVWYSTITIYSAYRGVFDIQHLLKTLSRGEFNPDAPESPVKDTV
jgi:hypothetical protein